MKIPSNMTEEQLMDQINLVVGRIAPKYTFYGYDVNDIKQESFIICVDALERYDPSRPLENFLSVHLSNRLKNFVRDNHFLKGEDDKRRIVQPGQLVNDDTILDRTHYPSSTPSQQYSETHEGMDYTEMASILDRKLPANYRSDYLKIVNDVYVPKKRKEEVLQLVHIILEEHGHA